VKEITIKVPEWMNEDEVKKMVEGYVVKKKLVEKYYSLIEGVDFSEVERESREFRKSFKLRNAR
jgi:hypothetical protein